MSHRGRAAAAAAAESSSNRRDSEQQQRGGRARVGRESWRKREGGRTSIAPAHRNRQGRCSTRHTGASQLVGTLRHGGEPLRLDAHHPPTTSDHPSAVVSALDGAVVQGAGRAGLVVPAVHADRIARAQVPARQARRNTHTRRGTWMSKQASMCVDGCQGSHIHSRGMLDRSAVKWAARRQHFAAAAKIIGQPARQPSRQPGKQAHQRRAVQSEDAVTR